MFQQSVITAAHMKLALNAFMMKLSVCLCLLLGRWECPWHQCNECGKEAASFCEMCPNSYCEKHRDDTLFISKLDGKLSCSEHDPCGPDPLEPGEIREYVPGIPVLSTPPGAAKCRLTPPSAELYSPPAPRGAPMSLQRVPFEDDVVLEEDLLPASSLSKEVKDDIMAEVEDGEVVEGLIGSEDVGLELIEEDEDGEVDFEDCDDEDDQEGFEKQWDEDEWDDNSCVDEDFEAEGLEDESYRGK